MTNVMSIIGPEPQREGEEPTYYRVGYRDVTRITRREENLGAMAIVWYDVYIKEILSCSCNALHLAEVIYFPSETSYE